MGDFISTNINRDDEPFFYPENFEKFADKSRPIREMKASTEAMDRARIDQDRRDFCAHVYLDFLKCRRDWFPNIWQCGSLQEDYRKCRENDYKYRMMEYERTKRLMKREKKRLEREKSETLAE